MPTWNTQNTSKRKSCRGILIRWPNHSVGSLTPRSSGSTLSLHRISLHSKPCLRLSSALLHWSLIFCCCGLVLLVTTQSSWPPMRVGAWVDHQVRNFAQCTQNSRCQFICRLSNSLSPSLESHPPQQRYLCTRRLVELSPIEHAEAGPACLVADSEKV